MNLPVLKMVSHWSNLTCFLTVNTSVCFHLVVAKPSGGGFINSCVSSLIYPCSHQTSVTDEGFPGGTVVKNLPAKVGDTGDRVWSLGREEPLEEEMAICSSILAMEEYSCPWKILHGQRSLAGYSPRGLKESNTTEWLSMSQVSFCLVQMSLEGAGFSWQEVVSQGWS